MSTTVNRELRRGDSLFFLDSAWKDLTTEDIFTVPAGQQPPPNSAPVDLTGAKIWFTVKNAVNDPDRAAVVSLFTPSSGVAVLIAAQGTFSVTGDPNTFAAYGDMPVDFVFDLQLKEASGRITTIETGTLVVTPDVTRATV
jgi:hypothetical protein